ncbi:MAG: hypothetical protein H3Z54_14275 [archaeon]|nr:hypothetical protein [archaeon]
MERPKKTELQELYETLKKEAHEFGFWYRLPELNEELTPLLLEDKINEALNLLIEKRLEFWHYYTWRRIAELGEILRPRTIFEDEVFNEVRESKQRYALAEKKCKEKDLTAIDDFREILENVNRIKERAERSRSKSAFNFFLKTIQWGVVISFASLTVIFYFISPTLYVVPVPFVIMISLAIGGYFVLKKYPYISTRGLMWIVSLIMAILIPIMTSLIVSFLR